MAGVLVATLIGYLVTQSSLQEAETQSQARPEDPGRGPSFRSSDDEEFASDRVLVKLREGVSSQALDTVNRQNNARTDRRIPRTRTNVVRLPRGLEVRDAIRRYEASPDVEYAEPDFILRPSQTISANDPHYPRLYGLNNTGQNGGAADADIDAPEAWNTTIGDAGTVVAVIDEGVDINHPDLRNNIWTNTDELPDNGLDDDRNGYVDDVNGYDFAGNDASVYDPDPLSGAGDEHGTHVAGTIAAQGNNSLGVVGVNWRVRIMPLKFLGPDGGYTSDAVEALNYAVAEGVKISNNSWGGGGSSRTLLEAINRADQAGHLFVAAAGNGGADGVGDDNDATPQYPSSYNSPNVIAVAATDGRDALAGFSNYGSTSVDLAAPGVGILSTLPRNTYGSYSGTSMATPHVSGVAALLKSNDPTLDDAALKDRILRSVDRKNGLSGRTATGGRSNAAQA
ncbi:MAG: S8 family serine peptidase, partial [Actinomycetota bacterium]|nr:S8 family serine peptidase [Actinomycetota bacterium]